MRLHTIRVLTTALVTGLVAVAAAQTVTEEIAPGVTMTTSNGTSVVNGNALIAADADGGRWTFGSACAPEINSIGPFSGQYHESWESNTQPNWPGGFQPCLPDGIFGPNQQVASMCANLAHITGGWSFSCQMRPHGGSRLYGNTGGRNVITFNTAAAGKFGGYFGTHTPDEPNANIAFYDDSGDLICQTIMEYPNNCTWKWFGFRMNVPVKRIEIWGFRGTGGYVLMDDMEYTPGPVCGDPCDMNCDGVVDASDIEFFIDLLFNGAEPCASCTGDVNGDGSIDAGDIEGFINCLFGP